MPETDLLLTDSDRLTLLHWTLEQGAVLVPDLHYYEPHYEEIRSISKLEQFATEIKFYVLRDDWQVEKLLMNPYVNKFTGAGFRISQRYGGPALSYALYPLRKEGGRLILGRGTTDYYPFYYSIAGREKLYPNDTLKAFYAQAIRLMKHGGMRIKGKHRSVYVTQQGTQLLASRQVFAPEPWNELVGAEQKG